MTHHIIRTMEEMLELDPQTALTVFTWETATIWSASYFQVRYEKDGYIPMLPAVVIATGKQVRAARGALKEAKND